MKKIFTAILATTAITLGAAAFTACDFSAATYAVNAAEAQEIAIAHTGVSATLVQNSTVVLEETATSSYYDVEFTIDGVQYCYRIDTTTGEIQKLTINEQPVDATSAPAVPASTTGNTSYIGFDTAKEIAFADAGVTSETQVTELSMEFDFDDGQYLYEIEFVYSLAEYDYEITAISGEIYKKNVDHVTVGGTVDENVSYIGTSAAVEIALADAGVTAEQATVTQVEFDKNKGTHVYEVEFIVDGTEYEYEINATTGAVIKRNVENQPTVSENGLIGLAAAKEIALAHAGLTEADVIWTEAKLDVEKGQSVYELEFTSSNGEYEYEISATTGSILDWDAEYQPTISADGLIGLDAAKAIALNHAGVASANAVWKEAKVELEKGRYVYELEFTSAGYEYEYEIDGTTGSILDWDKDRDD